MFIEGFNEFILWSKVVSVLQDINLPTIFSDSEILGNVTSAEVRENVTQSTTNYFAQNLPQSYEMWQTAHSAMANLSTIPNSFWAELAKYENNSIPYNALPQADITKVEDILSVLLASIENTVFTNYGIELGDDHASTTSFAWNSDDGDPTAQTDINTRSWQHYILVVSRQPFTLKLITGISTKHAEKTLNVSVTVQVRLYCSRCNTHHAAGP